MNGCISVVIPVYNAELEIEKCLYSILAQTYRDFQIILVDDGSIDDSPIICDKWASLDQRIEVIHQENKGVSSARNTGLEFAKGEFLFFMDSDDYLSNDKLFEKVIIVFQEQNVDAVFFAWKMQAEQGAETIFIPGKNGVIRALEAAVNIVEDFYNVACGGGYPWNKMWRLSAVKKDYKDSLLKFDIEKSVYEDLEWILKALVHMESVALLEEVGYQYMVRENSLSHNSQKKVDIYIDGLTSLEEMVSNFAECDQRLIQALKSRYRKLLLYRCSYALKDHNSKLFNKAYAGLKKEWKNILLSKHITIKNKLLCLKIMIVSVLMFRKLILF